MNLNLSCTFEGHQNNPINWICINENCKIKPACISCVTQNHNQHSHDVLDLSKFIKWQKQEAQKINQLTSQLLNTIKQIISLSKPLKSFMQKLMTFQKFELTDQTIEQITNQVNRLLGFQKDQQAFLNQFSEINKYLQLVKVVCENLNSQTPNKVTIQQPQIQNLIEYHFSDQEKHNQLEVQGNEISRKLFSGTQIYFCLCSPTIQDSLKLNFQVIEIRNQILLGICNRIKMRKNKFGEQKLDSLGHGCYLINNEGSCFSHHQKKINNKSMAFTFSGGDSIQIEIKGNIIQWKKNKDQQSGESIQMEFENIGDMFPVVGISPDCKIILRK